MSNSKETETPMKTLYDLVKATNAGESHMVVNAPFKDSEVTAVYSVYEGQRPSHEVLDDLYDWAMKNDESLTKRIEDLSQLREEGK